jgi:uncharacterized protein with FMN-binding domain
MDGIRSLGSRAGLAIASLLLGAGLVLGFKAPDDSTGQVASRTGTGTNGSTSSSGGGATSTSAPKAGTQTVTGTLISTRYGPVQVQVTVSNGKVTAITAVALPSGGRSGMISRYAAPILTGEALAAQSSTIDLVSGATYTSLGYEKSLQAALNQAGL